MSKVASHQAAPSTGVDVLDYAANEFTVGDTVQLKSGGHELTIVEVRNQSYLLCVRTCATGQRHFEQFHRNMLVKTEYFRPLTTFVPVF